MFRASGLTAGLITLLACVSMPDTYRPEGRREPVVAPPRGQLKDIVAMADRDAQIHILSGVGPQVHSGAWRWAGRHASFRVRPAKTENQQLLVDFAIAEDTFKHTGPVTITFLVNKRDLTTVTFDKPGSYQLRESVPREWLHAGFEALIEILVSEAHVAADGVELALILHRVGLTQ